MEISPKELYKKMQDPDFRSTSILVDVRLPAEHKLASIASSYNIPLPALADARGELETYQHIYFHCETGGRSALACRQMEEMMLASSTNVVGGIQAWIREGLPVLRS